MDKTVAFVIVLCVNSVCVAEFKCGLCRCSTDLKTVICSGLGLHDVPTLPDLSKQRVVALGLQRNSIHQLHVSYLHQFPQLRYLNIQQQRGVACVRLDGLMPPRISVEGHICATPTAGPRPPPFIPPIILDDDNEEENEAEVDSTTEVATTDLTASMSGFETTVSEIDVEEGLQETAADEEHDGQVWEKLGNHVSTLLRSIKNHQIAVYTVVGVTVTLLTSGCCCCVWRRYYRNASQRHRAAVHRTSPPPLQDPTISSTSGQETTLQMSEVPLDTPATISPTVCQHEGACACPSLRDYPPPPLPSSFAGSLPPPPPPLPSTFELPADRRLHYADSSSDDSVKGWGWVFCKRPVKKHKRK